MGSLWVWLATPSMPSSSQSVLQGVQEAAISINHYPGNALLENARRVPLSLAVDEYSDGARNSSGGAVKVIGGIDDQDIIDRILTHLRDREQATPACRS